MTRLEELKKQATEDILGVKILNADIFAELIVKECVKIVQPEPYEGDATTASLNAKVKQIKDKFGVE